MKQKTRILVVDDDANLRKTLADILRIKGYETAIAATGAEAVAAVERAVFSLALIDLMLPDMPGLEVMARIKATSPSTEAIILTGHASMDTAIEATRQGAYSYLLKPYQMDDLLRNIGHGVERQQAQTEIRRLSEALRQAHEAIAVADANSNLEYVNPAFTKLLGYTIEDLTGQSIDLIGVSGDSETGPARVTSIATTQGGFSGEVLRRAKDGRIVPVLLNVAPIFDEHGRITNYVGTMADLSELKRAEREALQRMKELSRANAELRELNVKLEQAQSQLLQSEKMASIGQLAAGVAHEINNPIGFVNSNLGTLGKYIADLSRVIEAYELAEAKVGAHAFMEVAEVKRAVDLPYLMEDIPNLLKESQDGLARVKRIITDLRDFSHVDESTWQFANLEHGMDSTLNVVWNEIKYKAEVVKEYAGLPEVECMPSQLNQVFLNLLMNAVQAIDSKGVITIRTGLQDDGVWVEVADTGKGIPPEQTSRIFDPFFTTKPVGQGTGLGLSVSYGIVQKHGGRIEVNSTPGKGTAMRVWLPQRRTTPLEV